MGMSVLRLKNGDGMNTNGRGIMDSSGVIVCVMGGDRVNG